MITYSSYNSLTQCIFPSTLRRSTLHSKSIIVVQGARGKLQGVAWMIFRGYQHLGGEHERIK